MSYALEHITKESIWSTLPISQWQHTWEYGEVQKISHRTVHRFIIKNTTSSDYVGFFQVVTYPFFKGKNISYIPYGPVFTDQPNSDLLQWLHEELVLFGKRQNSICVRCELDSNGIFTKLPLSAYRTSFHQPRGEVLLDLSDAQNVQNNFSKSTRRNITKANKNDLVFSFFNGPAMNNQLQNFLDINISNTKDHKTTTHPDQYFIDLFSVLSKNKNNFVSVISTQDQAPLAINIFTVFGNYAYCPFGASTSLGKELGAYYKIKKESIDHLVSKNITSFNWGGISVGMNDENLQGLNNFKLGFGGSQVIHDRFYDAVCASFYYWIYIIRACIKKR